MRRGREWNFTDSEVLTLRKKYCHIREWNYKTIGGRYGVDPELVRRILYRKNRQSYKLSRTDVSSIRKEYANHMFRLKDLAAELVVTSCSVGRMLRGETYKWVKGGLV